MHKASYPNQGKTTWVSAPLFPALHHGLSAITFATPASIPAEMVAPDRENPRNGRQKPCAAPMSAACFELKTSMSALSGCRVWSEHGDCRVSQTSQRRQCNSSDLASDQLTLRKNCSSPSIVHMRRRFAWISLLLVCVILLGGPVFEHFDQWDNFPQSGNDIVLTVVAVVICIASAASLIRTLEQTSTTSIDLPPKHASARHTPVAQENCSYSDSPGFQASPLRI